MAVFEVGKFYEPADFGMDAIKILRRTEKTVWVDKDGVRWMMRVRRDKDGDEFAIDSSVPLKWRDAFMYSAKWETKME